MAATPATARAERARVMDAEAAVDTRVFWDASGLAGGLYVLRLSTPDAALARLAVVSP